ncbi:DUF397 domain-containing protein [Micromonospora sp. WMMD712]|uniref:DUF397 domain-containing protein n=1 Tax=Micromonospora TaxID=1873 RepID=UPI002499FDE9|nr:DUF397 domain-containing protein [Micromonospora sp. WMMD712]WFE58417.1 DUF397 domain-containing protein [Micromonospora sp. WMMD712]
MDVSRAEWKKSSRSGSSGSCIEVADNLLKIMVRDSKDRHGPLLSFTSKQWTGFVKGLKAGSIDY